ncbi:hypothetical protein [Gracilibacillus sp. YIM 98692]|uniref:hypothetical protein n=1 Tax=Gracilibacillus sp. YIM 98692 TaxID=2663532 RepID=UPI0013CF5FAA|nr:hypothetical protein [Gracilibacillus sp. YIM 98692]
MTTDKKYMVINSSTGEIEHTTDVVITEEQVKEKQERQANGRAVYRARKNYHEKDNRRFVINFISPIRGLLPNLTLTDAGVMMKLLPYTQTDRKLKKNGKALEIADISKIIKRSEKPTRRALSRLENVSLLESTGRPKNYYVNPFYHLKGSLKGRKDEKFVKLYKSKAKELLDRLSLNEAGIVYKILPFFHYETFILCGNPNEENPKLYEELSQTMLSELIGHDKDELNKLMKSLRTKGVLMQSESSYVKSHYVHPDLFYRKDYEDEHTREIRAMFERNEIRKQARVIRKK